MLHATSLPRCPGGGERPLPSRPADRRVGQERDGEPEDGGQRRDQPEAEAGGEPDRRGEPEHRPGGEVASPRPGSARSCRPRGRRRRRSSPRRGASGPCGPPRRGRRRGRPGCRVTSENAAGGEPDEHVGAEPRRARLRLALVADAARKAAAAPTRRRRMTGKGSDRPPRNSFASILPATPGRGFGSGMAFPPRLTHGPLRHEAGEGKRGMRAMQVVELGRPLALAEVPRAGAGAGRGRCSGCWPAGSTSPTR